MKTLLIFLAFQLVGKPSQLPNEKLTKSPFVSTNFVITAFSECDKFVYIGTNYGVIKKNKKTKKVTTISMLNSKLPSNMITSLACSNNGNAYIGTSGGIMLWDGYSDLLITTENSDIPENHITALFIDEDDNLWIGTLNSGVVKGIGTDIKPFNTIPLMTSNNQIYSITVDKLDRIWVGYKDGSLDCYANSNFTRYPAGHDMEKVKTGYAGTFLINVSEKGTYYNDGTHFILMCRDRSVQQNTSSYCPPKTAKVIVCSKNSIDVFNTKSPHNPPTEQSYESFLQSVSDGSHPDIPPKDKKTKRLNSKD